MGAYTSLGGRIQGRRPLTRAQFNRFLGKSRVPQWALHLELCRTLLDSKKVRVYQSDLPWAKAFVSESFKLDKGTQDVSHIFQLPKWEPGLKCQFSSFWLERLVDEVYRRGETFQSILLRRPGSLIASRLVSKDAREGQPLEQDTPLLRDCYSLLLALDLKRLGVVSKFLQDPFHQGWDFSRQEELLHDRHLRDMVHRVCTRDMDQLPSVSALRR